MGSTDDSYDHTQDHTNDQSQGGDQQGSAYAFQILQPAIIFDKSLIEFDKDLLPKGYGLAGPDQSFP